MKDPMQKLIEVHEKQLRLFLCLLHLQVGKERTGRLPGEDNPEHSEEQNEIYEGGFADGQHSAYKNIARMIREYLLPERENPF